MRIDHPLRAADAMSAMGINSYRKWKTAEALRALFKVYEIVKNLGTSQNSRKIKAIGTITNAYNQSGNFQKALEWNQLEFPLIQDESIENLRPLKVDYFMRRGVIYGNLNQVDSAILMIQKAIGLQEKYETYIDRSELLFRLGDAYFKKGDCTNAHRYLQEAAQIRKHGSPHSNTLLRLSLAETYFCLGKLDSAAIFSKSVLQAPYPNVEVWGLEFGVWRFREFGV